MGGSDRRGKRWQRAQTHGRTSRRRVSLHVWRTGCWTFPTSSGEYRSYNSLPSRIFDWLIDISAFAGALIVLYVALTIGANVLGRYVFESPLKWALPTTEYSLLYLTFLAAPVVLGGKATCA